MVARKSARAARGFTLIELMIVVAIIGVLASIAIPSFGIVTLRSKASERAEVMLRIKKALNDLYVQTGSCVPRGMADPFTGDWQPPLNPGVTRRIPNWKDPNWHELFKTGEEIEGTLYYSYWFTCTDGDPSAGTPATLTIMARGDLDGDGVPSQKSMMFERQNGMYVLAPAPLGEVPPPGEEDALSY
jgi:type IV pilus assembly protein PilA